MGEMEYTAQNLEYAVSVFYNGEQSERTKAHAWLMAAQRVPEAWKFVWELLQPNKGTEIQFYAATTLHTKILRCWNEVPPESLEELKQKILEAVYTYARGPKIVTNRLCISLAAFILQAGTIDLADILRPLSTPENMPLLLEVLTVIPEEYNSMTMGLYLRAKNRAALQRACPAILDDMLRCLQTAYNDYSKEGPSEETVVSWVTASTCACSWLTLGGEDAPDCGGVPLPDLMPLCKALITVVKVLVTWNEAVSDTALDACESSLSAIRAAGSGAQAWRYQATALDLIKDLTDLSVPIMQRDNVPNSINEELLSSLITCLVSVCENHVKAVVTCAESEEDQAARPLIELLLAAQAAPGHYPAHETRSNLVFGAWYTLQDRIPYELDSSKKVHGIWREVFSQLLTTLVKKSEVHDSELSRDDLELLRCYRQDIADTVIYCYGILGDWCWSTVECAFTSSETEASREAALHVFLALADASPRDRVPDSFLTMLQHAIDIVNTSTDKRTLNTALDCLGGYAVWMCMAEESVRSRVVCACVCAAGAALPRAPHPAARALRRLTAECAAHTQPLLHDIVNAAKSEAGWREAGVRRQLLAAAGAALAAAAPAAPHQAAPLLAELAALLAHCLRAQAADPIRGAGGAESASALVGALTSQTNLAAQLVRDLTPELQPFARHPLLVEPMFEFINKAVSTLLEQSLPLINDIASLTITGFGTRPSVAGLDVVKLLVLAIGSDWPEMGQLFNVCLTSTVAVIASEPACPDLIEATFTVVRTITKRKPQYLDWIEDLLPQLVELGCSSVRAWEAGTARAACLWLGALAGVRPACLLPRAPLLTAAALHCIGGATPRNQIEPLAELLLALNRADWSELGNLDTWLRQALAVNDFPTVHATQPYKHKFIAAVIKEKRNKRRLLETVQEFSLVCRGLIGTEYARQTIASKQLVA